MENMRCYGDIEVGEYLTSSELVDGEDMIAFAKNYDPQWFHFRSSSLIPCVWRGHCRWYLCCRFMAQT